MLDIQSVSKSFSGAQILNRVSLSVRQAEIFCLLGPSGAGKTTLLNIVSGLMPADEGQVETLAKRTAYVFQEDRLLPWMTVRENIELVNENLSKTDLDAILDEMDLLKSSEMYPEALSGGMRQRVAIARAFAYTPDLLLMDEPFKSLDFSLRARLIEALLKIWGKNQTTVFFVTHDMDEALWIADRIAILGKSPAGIVKTFEVARPRQLTGEEHEAMKRYIQTIWEEDL
ncbi:MAG: NitT/TauT family transport system ATP-binding protein [Clostridiales bacterium]|jgi:NitT/TauT family transport system ATP-binding protein|nr:NitT/TauT family transport system ATP-binding protein [Clostridiales bacterium]